MIIDFHVHTFPSKIRNNRENYFKGEPAFKLLYKSSKQKLVGCSEIIEQMNEHKISVSVVFGFPWYNHDTCRINNDYVIKMVKKHPDRLKGFCCVDPFHPMAANEVERCYNLGLSGVGEIAFYKDGINDACLLAMNPIMEFCRNKDIPLLLHTNEEIGHLYPGKSQSSMGQLYKFIKQFPLNKIVLSHWGGGLFFFNLLKKEVTSVLSNIYYDIAASPFLYDKNIYQIAKKIIGADRFIFGTDYPLLPPSRYFNEMLSGGLNQDDMHKICFDNASKLLKSF